MNTMNRIKQIGIKNKRRFILYSFSHIRNNEVPHVVMIPTNIIFAIFLQSEHG